MIGKLSCRLGRHQITLHDWPLGEGKHPACVRECKRCGVVEQWAGAWDSAVCIGRWPSYEEFQKAHGNDAVNPIYGVMDPDYARFLSKARCTAKMDGYALAIHGSFTRDLDVVAVPWVDKPKKAEPFVHHVAHRTGMLIHHPMQLREHGRRVWTLHFPELEDPRFIDFSVMPTQP